jgi:hypothetical protein
MNVGAALVNYPIGDFIYNIANAIAMSQGKLDQASVEVAEMMGGLQSVFDDEGNMTFNDSRVFFGHEYMTVAEAMVTQGTGNPVAEALIAAETVTYRSYAPATPLETTPITVTPADIVGVPLNATSLAAYQANAQAVAQGLADLEALRAAATGAQKIANLNARLKELKDLQEANRNSVANIFERQVRFPTRLSLLELGFTPTFYQFVDTIIEVKISISMTQETSSLTSTGSSGTGRSMSFGFRFSPFGKHRGGGGTQTTVSSVSTEHQSKYSVTGEGSSLIRTKLVPLPPPPILEERIRAIMVGDQARRAAELSLLTTAAGTV